MADIPEREGITASIVGKTRYPDLHDRLKAIKLWIAENPNGHWIALDDSPIADERASALQWNPPTYTVSHDSEGNIAFIVKTQSASVPVIRYGSLGRQKTPPASTSSPMGPSTPSPGSTKKAESS